MTTDSSYAISLFARWPDMDFNQHMRNAAFLGASEDCRMRFLSDRGFTMAEFLRRRLGPVVLEDRLVYKKELKLLEPFRVDLELAAITRDGRRMKVRNSFFRDPDGAHAATVESVVIWLDLAERKPVAPPDDLKAAWLSLRRSEDFAWYD
jgi:acyl-CoA thioester hydrolase